MLEDFNRIPDDYWRTLLNTFRHTTQIGIYRFIGEHEDLEIRQPGFQEYLEVFPEIGHYAGGNIRVIETLLTALANITEIATRLKLQEYQDLLTVASATLAAQYLVT
jgi:hypothetical protein